MSTFNSTIQVISALPRAKVLKGRNSSVFSVVGSGSGNGGGVSSGSWLDPYFTYNPTTKSLILNQPDPAETEINFCNDAGDVVAYSAAGGTIPSIWDSMPIASATVLGGIKVGTNLSIDGNGVLSATGGGTVLGSGLSNTMTYWTNSNTLGFLNTTTYPSLTELSYVKGVTSAIQTQLNGKQAAISLLPNRALRSASDGTIAVSATTSDELGFLSGVTSSVQTQLGNKANLAGASFTGDISVTTGGNTTALRGAMLEFQRTTGSSYIDNRGTGQSIVVRTSNAGAVDTNAIAITADGDIGIGTLSPSYGKVEIKSAFNTTSPILAFFGADGTYNPRVIINHITSSSTHKLQFDSTYTAGSGYASYEFLGDVRVQNSVMMKRSTGGLYLDVMSFGDTLGGTVTDNLSIGNTGGGQVRLHTNNVEVVRIDTSGNMLVKNEITAFSTTLSDIRLKKDIIDINYGIDDIIKLRAVEYKLKSNNTSHLGFIAQEVEVIIPEITKQIDFFDDKLLSINYQEIIPILVKSIQQLKQEINTLKLK